MVVKDFARKAGWCFKEEWRFSALVAKGQIGDAVVHLVLPTTYMNLSGMAVRPYLDYYKLGADTLLVVSDDTALPFGQIRLRSMGSPGGHNGLKSVEAYLGTSQYARLKMGVGAPEPGRGLADYVLAPFGAEEIAALGAFIDRGTLVLNHLLDDSVSNVMNKVNTKVEMINKPPETGEEKRNESKTKPL